jgi:hypothetical protein
MTNFAPQKKPFPKALRPDKKFETKGDEFRKKMKEKEKLVFDPKTDEFKNIMEMEKSLKNFKEAAENLKKDERFPKPPVKKRGIGKGAKESQPNPPSRKPGEQKEMQPLSKGGRAGFKRGSKGCKLAMKGKGRAYGKNS